MQILIPLLAAACAVHPPAEPARPAATEAPPSSFLSLELAAATEVEALADLRCRDDGVCAVVVEGQLRVLEPKSLALSEPIEPAAGRLLAADPWAWLACDGGRCMGPQGEVALEQRPGVTDPAQLALAWRSRLEERERVPFERRIPAPGGATISYLRGHTETGAQLVRAGAGHRVASAPGSDHPSAYPGWLALHPSGREAYLLVWPGGRLVAFDPITLATRWKLDLQPAAHGLFIDPAGRYLVVGVGGETHDGRLLDFDPEGSLLLPDQSSATDLNLGLIERPRESGVVVVDVSVPRVVAELPGAYRAWVPLADAAVLVATSRVIVRLGAPAP